VPAAIFYYFKFLPLVQFFTFMYVLKQMFFDLVYDFYYLVLYFFLQQSFFFQGSAQSFGPNRLPRADRRELTTASSAPVFGIQGGDKLSHINAQVPLIFKTSGALNLAGLDLLPAGPTQTNHLLPKETVTSGSSALFSLNSSSYTLTSQLNPNFSRVINFSTQHNTSSATFLNKNPYTHSYLTSQLLSSTKQYRWLTKNYLNTSDLSTNSHQITQSKFLISNSLLDTDKLKKNIWLANNLNNLTTNFFKELNNTSTKGSEPYNYFEYSRFFVNMRFFNLVNFANVLPALSTKSLNSQSASLVSSHTLPYFSQNQNAQSLDFNFNNLISNPETRNPSSWVPGHPAATNTTSMHLNYADHEVFNPASLEVFNNINTTRLSADSAWSVNYQMVDQIFKS
jgi:hypothetical protein